MSSLLVNIPVAFSVSLILHAFISKSSIYLKKTCLFLTVSCFIFILSIATFISLNIIVLCLCLIILIFEIFADLFVCVVSAGSSSCVSVTSKCEFSFFENLYMGLL